ncbi:hypothetical protein [Helicobacter labetoulli]|uniref:hypothetical protein n=1 Tax=Helicobacter labetoulli TaxID=2315333 RepID=UPI001ABF736D|nr:hypothetical protein [Helicobacter labetoulli]
MFELIEFHKKHWLGDLPSESKDVIQAIKDKKGANIFDKGNGFAKAYKNATDELKEREKLDTKERIENFYYSLHILEGLFFVKDKLSISREYKQTFYCPCRDNSILDKKQTKDNEYQLKCPSCERILSFKNLKRILRKNNLSTTRIYLGNYY